LFKLLFSIYLCLIPLSVSAEAVDVWLDKMATAQRQQNFQGTLIIRQNNQLRAVNVRQGVSEGKNWQTLESQTGENQLVFRQDGHVATVFPAKKLITVSASMGVTGHKDPLHPALPVNRDKLKQLYLLKLGNEDRIANKATQIVNMIPKDKHRYGYTFWLDKQSGLLLKCNLINYKGQVLEQLMYSNIELLSTAPQNKYEEYKLGAFKKVMLSDKSDVKSNNWQAESIPAGFVLTRSVKTVQESPRYHMVFSDGMASVSVFIEPAGEKQKLMVGQSSMGPVHAFSLLNNDAFITAIGEVPASTVRIIAQSIQSVH
jgi:sigma-E factor negative regulatory protein RseB